MHILRGTFRRDRHGNTPEIAVEIPKAPRDLDKRARTAWRYYAPLLTQMRTISLADREALACYCVAVSRRQQAEEGIAKSGLLVKSPNGYPMQTPWLAIANKSMEQMLKWGQELGLSPVARSRIKIAAKAPDAVPNRRSAQVS